ncbi:hypothetical protein JIN84_05635 [Luteolibacter yonseiensis]|uniref:Uncharacterized protein n=1 Tax=Luteolibacter yonseiensis TaxID=1144680 RepID=A0A934R1L0_9BACT|nr:hypothetical protein [Luteolibacter yonseiensis]MBK1815082.1 hypothetical protein [Luteolibacter yonseiensis]
MKKIRSRKVWAGIAVVELPLMAVCLWLMGRNGQDAGMPPEPAPSVRREAVRPVAPLVKVEPGRRPDGGPDADEGAGWPGADGMSFKDCLAALAGEEDAKERARLLRVLVGTHGRAHAAEVYEYLVKHRPRSEAREPLIRLGIMSVTDHEMVFRSVLHDTAPGGARSSLLKAAVVSLPPEKLMELIAGLDPRYGKEDDYRIASLLGEDTLGRPEMTEEVLAGMLSKAETRFVGQSLAGEIIRRKLKVLYKNPGTEIQDIGTLSAGIPAAFRDFYVNRYYEGAVIVALRDKHRYEDLAAKGMPGEFLDTFVRKLAQRRCDSDGSHRGAMEKITDIPEVARPYYLKTIASHWMTSDSIGASRTIGGMPPGRDRDVMVAEVARFSRNNGDAESAMKWASEISDEALRERLVKEVAGE